MKVTIFHNPRCSKSRETLNLLKDKDIEPEIVDYMNSPPTTDKIKEILNLLNLAPRELLRCNESAYKNLNLDDESLSDEKLISAMTAHPSLIERPIVIVDNKSAVIGRPPENILEIL